MKVVTKDEFQEILSNSDTPILVDYFADWCGPCKMLAPIIEKLAPDYEGKIKIVKVDIDDQPELAQEQNVRSIPTLVVYKDGKEASREVGFKTEAQLKEMLDAQS